MMKKNSGFTLIEILVVSVVIVILGGAILGLNIMIGQTQTTAFRSFTTVDQTNASVSSIVKEIRTAQYGDNGAYPIEYADTQNIIFYSDIDVDGDSEKVSYFMEGTELKKSVTEPSGIPPQYIPENETTRVIASNVRNGGAPIFYYFNEDYPADSQNNPMSYPASIAQVHLVEIMLRVNQIDNPNTDYILNSATEIRLLKNNL